MRVLRYVRQIELLRNWILVATLSLVTLPGFAGHDMFFLGIRLGRFQPFKFLFIFWLVLQTLCIFHQYQDHFVAWLFRFLKSRSHLVLLASILGMDLLLGMSLLLEGNPARGFSILFSLILGQLAAVLTVMDKNFPVRWLLRGICSATFILIFFSLMELLFPHSAFMVAFLSMVRNSANVSYQLGSSLSVVALAEFTIRSLPLVLLFSSRLWWCAICALGLTLMGFLTLEKSAFLSLLMIFGAAIFSSHGRRYWKQIVLAVGIIAAFAVGVAGFEKVSGRFFGTGILGGSSLYAQGSDAAMKERRYLYKLAGQTIRAKPWFGIGLDGFAYRSENKTYPLETAYRPEGSHSHNLFLEMGVSGGIVALLALVLAYGTFAGLCFHARPIHWCGILYLAGQFVSCMTDARIYVSWLAITFFWFAGIAWKLDGEFPAENFGSAATRNASSRRIR